MVVVSLLLHLVEFTPCAASCPGSVDDKVLAAVKQEVSPLPDGPRAPAPYGCAACKSPSLELELIQPDMAQKPVLRGDVGARALRVWFVSREEALASAGVKGAWVSRCGDPTNSATNS